MAHRGRLTAVCRLHLGLDAVEPAGALVRYTIPMTEDSPTGERDAEEMALHSPVLSTVKSGGPDWESDRQRANIGRRAGAYKFIAGSS